MTHNMLMCKWEEVDVLSSSARKAVLIAHAVSKTGFDAFNWCATYAIDVLSSQA